MIFSTQEKINMLCFVNVITNLDLRISNIVLTFGKWGIFKHKMHPESSTFSKKKRMPSVVCFGFKTIAYYDESKAILDRQIF